MDRVKYLATAIELHDAKAMDKAFAEGIHPNDAFEDDSWFGLLLSMYTRSPRFADCVKVCMQHGLQWETPALLAVLSNDDHWLQRQLSEHPKLALASYYMRNAFTGMEGVSLLHVCAEFNHVASAEVVLDNGLPIDETALIDENGFGGQTALYHTVNQNGNASKEMMLWLLDKGANPLQTVKGVYWGKSFQWETLVPGVNAIGYAMMGLLPQMHRHEKDIAGNIGLLMQHAYKQNITLPNIPNQYLSTK